MVRDHLEYNSDNTNRVTVEQVKEMLLELPYIQHELSQWKQQENVEKDSIIELM